MTDTAKCPYCHCPAHGVKPFSQAHLDTIRRNLHSWAMNGSDVYETERWLATLDALTEKLRQIEVDHCCCDVLNGYICGIHEAVRA